VKRLLVILMVVSLSVVVVGYSFAYFTDLEASVGNTFTAGTWGLETRDNRTLAPSPWFYGIDQTWKMGIIEPGVGYVANDVSLREVGTIPANHVEISFSSTIDEETIPPGVNPVVTDTNPTSQAGDLGKWLEVTSMLCSGENLIGRIAGFVITPEWDINGNGWLDLDDLIRSPLINADHGPLDDLLPPNATAGEGSFCMTVMLHSEATSDIQGDLLTLIVSFSLNHNPDQ
jgi:predicted ribosomally synthesized peptide with SipW-like signal peptide